MLHRLLALKTLPQRMDAHKLYTYQTRSPKPTTPTSTMSTLTLTDLEYISREDLSGLLLANPSTTETTSSPPPESSTSKPASPIAVIDVRDSDHIGGHIRNSTWIPSSTLDFKIPELVRTLQDQGVQTVVFHCALSQQRGPSAALRYMREKERLAGSSKNKEAGDGGVKEDKQKVLVLEGGFTQWQEVYGEDKRLTEGYQKDIWEFGY